MAAGLACFTAGAKTTVQNGLIAYQQDVRGATQLFTIRPDGTRATQITHVKGSALGPEWSRDGKLIAFTYETPPANGSVALVSSGGTGFRKVVPSSSDVTTGGHVWNGDPSFTPDGNEIVFARSQGPSDSGIWVMRTDGSHLRRLTTNPYVRNWDGGDVDPHVSPDGKVVSFVRIKKQERLQALFAVGVDGTGLKQLTTYGLEVGIKHDWSPDGKLIVLTTNADFVNKNEPANVATVHPDGSGLRLLTRFTGRKTNAFAGSFSPDGKHIVFRLERGSRYALAVVDRDGANRHLLTRLGKTKPAFIDWGPAPRS